MHFFDDLGLQVERAWKRVNYDDRRFSEVATEVVGANLSRDTPTFEQIIQWALKTEILPQQNDIDAKFGQPPLTVFLGNGFHIELLFWMDGRLDVHEHSFSGLFHVLHGSSLHIQWTFDVHHRVNSKLVLGNLVFQNAEVLHQGDTRPIVSGNEFIHTTFHLDTPSVTLVVRTNREIDRLPQMTYLYPSVGYASEEETPIVRRRAQLLELLFAMKGPEEYSRIVQEICEETDSYSAFYYIMQADRLLMGNEARRPLLNWFAERRPAVMDKVMPVLEFCVRRISLQQAGASLDRPIDKFVLVLLMAVPSLDSITRLLATEYPDENPIEIILDCIARLSALDVFEIRFNRTSLKIIRLLLLQISDTQIEAELMEQYGVEQVAANQQNLQALIRSLRQFWLLAPILPSWSPLDQEARSMQTT